MGIAKNLIYFRERRNFTQAELSEKVGVSQTFISKVEKGFKIPGLELTKRLASVLETTVDELVT